MTIRRDVSVIQNKFHDAQRVDETDLKVEQDNNNQIHAAIIQNHFGSGVVLNTPTQLILFDSDNLTAGQASVLAAGNFDGYGFDPHAQPSDANLGNQIEVELTSSNVIGRLCTKVAVIGLDFEGNLQFDRFTFFKNEKQVSAKHYAYILSVMFNDFKGNNNCSRNLGGSIVIREAASFQLSRDPISISQDRQPDLFWRDWKTPTAGLTLFSILQTAIGPAYDVAALNITTTGITETISAGDVVTQYGEKFKATTANIQKVTLLLGASKDSNVAT